MHFFRILLRRALSGIEKIFSRQIWSLMIGIKQGKASVLFLSERKAENEEET